MAARVLRWTHGCCTTRSVRPQERWFQSNEQKRRRQYYMYEVVRKELEAAKVCMWKLAGRSEMMPQAHQEAQAAQVSWNSSVLCMGKE